jgi:hypothetical protein
LHLAVAQGSSNCVVVTQKVHEPESQTGSEKYVTVSYEPSLVIVLAGNGHS